MDVYFLDNDLAAVFENEKQIPALQRSWIIMFAEHLEANGVDPLHVQFHMSDGKVAMLFKTDDGRYNWDFGLKPKDQIAYIPDHAGDDLDHPDVEFGFVTSVRNDTVFCRYWRRDLSGLRTKANSEGTPIRNLVRHESVLASQVEEAWEAWVEEN